MNRIALTAAAILVAASGSAFAGSDHYGSNNVNQPAVTQSANGIDQTYTGSIRKPVKHREFNGELKVTPDQNQPEPGQGIWGR